MSVLFQDAIFDQVLEIFYSEKFLLNCMLFTNYKPGKLYCNLA